MQKLVYLSNSRDYTEQGNINENKYFTNINSLLNQGWKVSHITHDVVEIEDKENPTRKETFCCFLFCLKSRRRIHNFLSVFCVHCTLYAIKPPVENQIQQVVVPYGKHLR